MGFQLKSNSFKSNQLLDKKYSCEGEDISPDLSWSGIPQGTKSLALIVDDPDAPRKEPWVHWVIFNIPASISHLKENISKQLAQDPNLRNAIQGTTDFGKTHYNGPCPPAGKPHRYFFTLYALDQELPLKANAKKNDIIKAMEGHILESTELVGLYQIK